jgi:hypothetical protein
MRGINILFFATDCGFNVTKRSEMTPTAKSRISNADSIPLIQSLFLKVCSEADISAISFVRFAPPNRTKVFHVKHFGTMDGLRKSIITRRRAVWFRDLGRAKFCDSIKLCRGVF